MGDRAWRVRGQSSNKFFSEWRVASEQAWSRGGGSCVPHIAASPLPQGTCRSAGRPVHAVPSLPAPLP